MQIISVPTVFTCKTPSEGWINLAQVRQIQHEEYPGTVIVITWFNGERQAFMGENAIAILEAWRQAAQKLERQCNCDNHRVQNRRSLNGR